MIRAIVEGLYWVATAASVAAGLYAARLWWGSAHVPYEPFQNGAVESGEPLVAQQQHLSELIRVGSETAKLNNSAALWTARAVLLGAAATVLDHLH